MGSLLFAAAVAVVLAIAGGITSSQNHFKIRRRH